MVQLQPSRSSETGQLSASARQILATLRRSATSGFPESWIVHLVERCIDGHRKPGSDRHWQVEKHGEEAVISPERFPDFELRGTTCREAAARASASAGQEIAQLLAPATDGRV
jgi:hypothetical protein